MTAVTVRLNTDSIKKIGEAMNIDEYVKNAAKQIRNKKERAQFESEMRNHILDRVEYASVGWSKPQPYKTRFKLLAR